MTTIDDLPNEILLVIFQQIGDKKNLTRTCKRWNELIANFLHLRIDVDTEERILTFLDMTFTRSYRKLSIYRVMLMRSDCYWARVSRQPGNVSVKRVRLEGDPYALLRKCLQLVRQYEGTVREMRLTFGSAMDKCLLAFLPRAKEPSSLESLIIDFNGWHMSHQEDGIVDRIEYVSQEGLKEISEMPKLKHFKYSDHRPKGDRTARWKLFDMIVRKAKAITSITLASGFYACFSDFRIIRSFSTHLQELSIVVWPKFVKDFFQLAFPEVKILTLDFASGLGFWSDMPVPAQFFQNAKSLIELTVTNVDNEEFYRQSIYCSATIIERLIINENQEITMDGLQNLTGLKELQLCALLEPEVQTAVPCSPSLKKLVIERHTSGFSFYGVLAKSVPYITELHITGDETLNDECLRIICTTMINIRRLILSLMSFVADPVTDLGLRNIGNLRTLEYLSLESLDDSFMGRFRYISLDWIPLICASEIHLNGFLMIDLLHLLDFMLNPSLRRLTLEQCGRTDRVTAAVSKLKQLMISSRPLPHIAIIGA